MPKFEVFYPGGRVEKSPPKIAEKPEVPKRAVRVTVWQGGRLVECKKRDKKSTL